MSDRDLELELEVDAEPQTVWRALTDREGLRGWFASDARTEVRPGGEWTIAQGKHAMTSEVEQVDEGRRLRVTGPPREGFSVTTDFIVEARAGTTVVRIVESGFGPGEDWDAEIRSRVSGWTRYLENLRHYVEAHPGEPAACAYLYAEFLGSDVAAWTALADVLKGGLEEPQLEEHPPQTIAGRVPELGDGRVLGSVESPGEGGMIWLQLIAYADRCDQLEEVEARVRKRLQEAFPAS